ncbi:MAG: energy-coupling factor transporter ATP-binding protein EcfA2 [Cocleimonas sp.]|jgi:energy-coupling factor transporter ATP-binding protein EcfA2
MASSILINQLIVVGRQKNYTVNFNPGVNIIYGDSATGKSSILNLIDYLLGSKKFESYPEIEAAGRYAILDVTLNEDRYTIKRDIFDATKPIEVFPCEYGKIEEFSAKKYLPNFKENPNFPNAEFYSEFLFNALNFNNVKIKESPSKDDSKLVRLSFRDLFKFCYVDQDDLGSKTFLKPDNYVLQVRNKEVFKYIFNALDSNISSLDNQISLKTKQRNNFDKTFTTIADFFRDSNFGSMPLLDDEITHTDKEISKSLEQISQLNDDYTGDNEVYESIKSTLIELSLERKELQQNMQDAELKIERFSRLKNDYLNDILKFKASLAARNRIGEISHEIVLCPVCDNNLEVESAKKKFDITPNEKINYEINILKRRVKDTENIVNETRRIWELNKATLRQLDESEKIARQLVAANTKELTSPYLAERDMYVTKLGEFQQKRKDLLERLKIRNQHNHLSNEIMSLDIKISQLKEQLEELKKNSPSMSEILSNLANNLKDYLNFVKIKSPTGISYDENSFTPKVRNIEYSNITSGGLRTIIGIGYLCSLMQEALNSTISYPSFLMIDTVGKYLGKTKEQKIVIDADTKLADNLEAVSDPAKYQNIFEYIINLATKYEDKNRTCQFILVDNDVPDHIMDQLSGFIVAHYSSERVNGLPVGFIDDSDIYH